MLAIWMYNHSVQYLRINVMSSYKKPMKLDVPKSMKNLHAGNKGAFVRPDRKLNGVFKKKLPINSEQSPKVINNSADLK